MRVRIEKIKELEDARVPNNKPVGAIREGFITDIPKVGFAFWVHKGGGQWFHTSEVKEIIDNNTFKTQNSVYRWGEIM